MIVNFYRTTGITAIIILFGLIFFLFGGTTQTNYRNDAKIPGWVFEIKNDVPDPSREYQLYLVLVDVESGSHILYEWKIEPDSEQ